MLSAKVPDVLSRLVPETQLLRIALMRIVCAPARKVTLVCLAGDSWSMKTSGSVIGPKAMAREHVAYWEGVLSQVVKSDDWQKDLERNFWSANFMTGAAVRQYVEQQGKLFREIFTELGMAKPQ